MSIQVVRLGDWCSQDRQSVRPGEKPELRYIGLETVESDTGRLLDGALSKTPEEPQANSFSFGPEHVLYGKLRPYLNKVALPTFSGKCSTELVPLLPANGLDRRYLAYFLRAPRTVARISDRTAGARMPRADMDFVLGLQMPLPAIAEQYSIVDLLSRAEGIVRLRRQAQQKAAELIPAIFVDMFGDPATNPKGWTEHALGTVVEEFRYGTSQKSGEQGYPTLRIPNVIGNALDPNGMKLVAVSRAEADRIRLVDGDLLFVRTNGNPDNVGRSAVYNADALVRAGFDGNNCLYASYLIRARLDRRKMAPYFLQAFLSSSEGRKRIRSEARTSAGQYNINTQGLASVVVPLPTLELQTDFVRRCQPVTSLVELQTAAFRKATAALEGLLTRVFSGEKRAVVALISQP